MAKTLPDWWFGKYRPIQTISPYQERLWGWTEVAINANSEATLIYWNAEEVPEGQPGVATGIKDWIWLITDSVVTLDENSLVKVRHGVGKLIDGDIYITGEIRELGYGGITGKLGSGLHVWYDEETPYCWWVKIYNYNSVPILCEHYLNGIAEYRGMERRSPTPKLIKLDIKNAIEFIENKEPYKVIVGIGARIRKYGIKEK